MKAVGGARIEDTERQVDGLKEGGRRHLAVVCGANNMVRDSVDVMTGMYRKLVERGRQVGCKSITLMGLLRRYDLDWRYEEKRGRLNRELEKLCQELQVRFVVDYEVGRSRMARDGLHLNARGRRELGGILFKEIVPFLQ